MSTLETESFTENPPRLRDKIKASPLADNPLLLGVAGIGFAVSFQTISHEASLHHLPGVPWLYPVGVDVGILALILEARKLAARHRSDLVPRVLAWALSLGTIYINVHGSPPHDWLGRTLHMIMPALWIVFLELTRYRQRADIRKAENVDPVPLARWLLDPWGTAKLKRRMVLQNILSYRLAVALEDARKHMHDLAVAHYGGRWGYWRRAPALLRTNIRKGRLGDKVTAAVSDALQWGTGGWEAAVVGAVTRAVLAGDVLEDAIRQERGDAETELTSPPPGEVQADSSGSGQAGQDRQVQGDSSGQDGSSGSGRRRRRSSRRRRGSSASDSGGSDIATEVAAFAILAENPDITGKELGERLGGLSEGYGCRLKRMYNNRIAGPDQQTTTTE